jgi:hypothetical protein
VDGEVLVESGDASVISNNTVVAGAYPEPGTTPFRETLKWPDRHYRAFTTKRFKYYEVDPAVGTRGARHMKETPTVV